MPHSVCEEEINDVIVFLQEVLPVDPSFVIQPKSPAEMSVKELKAAIKAAGLTQRAIGFTEKSEFVSLLQNYRAGKT